MQAIGMRKNDHKSFQLESGVMISGQKYLKAGAAYLSEFAFFELGKVLGLQQEKNQCKTSGITAGSAS
jgi:hypothetical protein